MNVLQFPWVTLKMHSKPYNQCKALLLPKMNSAHVGTQHTLETHFPLYHCMFLVHGCADEKEAKNKNKDQKERKLRKRSNPLSEGENRPSYRTPRERTLLRRWNSFTHSRLYRGSDDNHWPSSKITCRIWYASILFDNGVRLCRMVCLVTLAHANDF